MRAFALLFPLLGIFPLHASVVQPGDEPYQQLRRDETLYIYTPVAKDFVEDLAGYNRAFRQMYDQSFGWKLDEEEDLVLTSPRQQIANAYATVIPNVKTVWYPGGAGMLEQMAESSWLLTLVSHETSHLYQLNPKSGLNRPLASVFGNPLVIVPFWPVFLQPNLLLPTSVLEGNAVLNESRVNLGGRLHSGEMRALALAQIGAGDIDAVRLINDEFKFPFGETAYLQGGYFQAYLAGKYGIEKTNGFFLDQSGHYLWPLILNKTFRDHFGSSFYQEVHEYVHSMQALAAKQVSASGVPLDQGLFTGGLNADAGRIWWLSSSGSEPPVLHVFDKSTRSLSHRRMDIPIGKVFFDGDRPLAAASVRHDLHHIEYSLYGEGAHFDPRFRGQVVTDQRAGHTVSIDIAQSWREPRLLLDGDAFDIGHSNPVLDDSGHVYYFRQNGSERMLYRDRAPLVKFAGFYGKLTEVLPDGTVFFIGSTDYGSSLFQFRNQEITRVLDSDRVVDARIAGPGEFLIDEVGAHGHRFFTVSAHPKAAEPAVYSYPFTTQNVVPAKVAAGEQTEADEKPYNSLREQRYSSTDFRAVFAKRFSADASVNFTDPLEQQAFSAGMFWMQQRDREASFQYAFTKYLPRIYARYLYNHTWYRRFDGADAFTHNQYTLLGMELPLLKWRRWSAGSDLAFVYKNEERALETAPTVATPVSDRNLLGSLVRLKLDYEVPSELGFFPWRGFHLGYTNKLDTEGGTKSHNTSLAEVSYTHGFAHEIYVSVTGQAAWAENPDIRVEFRPGESSPEIRLERLSDADPFRIRSAGLGRAEFHKVFTTPAYSARWPVGLNRTAPLLIAQDIAMNADPLKKRPANLFEVGYGVDLEVLLLHKLPARLRLIHAIDTDEPKKSGLQMGFGFSRAF
jgi:hypothetical protein